MEWFSTFKDNPTTTDVTNIFSVLRQVMHKRFFDPALPYQETEDVRLEPLCPKALRDKNGDIIHSTTKELQKKKAIVTRLFFKDRKKFTKEQIDGMNMLTKAPYGQLFIQCVPGSGKTWFATRVALACMYSSVNEELTTVKQPACELPEEEDFDEDEDEDEENTIRPKITGLDDMPAEDKTKSEEGSEKKDEPQMTDAFDIPYLNFGPNLKHYRELISNASNKKTPEEFCQFFFDGIRRRFRQNIEKLTQKSTRLRQLMIIANQNVNGDDLAKLWGDLLNTKLKFNELIIRVTNLHQDEPYTDGRDTMVKTFKNIHMDQLLTPMAKRPMANRADLVVFLPENHRQRGALQEIPSDLFYDGNVRSPFDPRYPSKLELSWHTYMQETTRGTACEKQKQRQGPKQLEDRGIPPRQPHHGHLQVDHDEKGS